MYGRWIYDFHWPAFQKLNITLPNGSKVSCEVFEYCPCVLESEDSRSAFLLALSQAAASSSDSNRVSTRDESQSGPAKASSTETEGSSKPPGRADKKDSKSKPSSSSNPTLVHVDHAEESEDNELVPPVELDKQAKLKLEAQSTQHLLTHRPKNPYCQSCQRAKLQRKAHAKKKTPVEERHEAKAFGDLITGGHIVTIAEIEKSVDGKRDALVLYDIATQFLFCQPVFSRAKDETI